MDAAIRWSPHATSAGRERFLLVDVTDQSLTLHQIQQRSQQRVHYSPVARYGRLPNFGAFAWSSTDESIVALGLVSGSACLVRLGGIQDERPPSETLATFKLKQQRKCNSIALSSQNWLAVALDKTRSDNCLNVYDANGDHDNPIRKLCPAELVSSVRYFPSHPQELVVAAQRSLIRLYDLRDPYVSGSSNVQVSSRNVNNIVIDPMDENYFASAGSADDPSVSVWDKRWISQITPGGSGAVFDFRSAVGDPAKATTIWSLRYSGQRRGRLAISSNRGDLRVIDMNSLNSPIRDSPSSFHVSGGSSWTCNRYVSQTRSIESPSESLDEVAYANHRLIAFDWIAEGGLMHDQSILALRPNRKIDVIRVPCTIPQVTVTARNDIALALDDMSITETQPRSEAPTDQQRTAEDFGPSEYSGEVSRHEEGEERKIKCSLESPHVASILALSTLQRERCRQGYLWDCHKNMKIVASNWQLERLWEIINRFKEQAADQGMVASSLDLSFVGVAGICSEKVGNLSRRTHSPAIAKVEDAISALNLQRELPAFEGERTEFPDHRQLSLELCGWKFSTEALEVECQELIERGLYYQAIVQAVLHDKKHIALNFLRTLIRSKTVPNIGLGPLLASDSINEEQREMCRWMSADTEDPALKALLTFLITGDWRDVMKTNYLHTGYRVALALKYLNDTEVKGFLQSETARAVRNGDLEGILLTGLGDQAIDLLQTYITKTNDLQTAVLASAFANPLYVDDVRWDMWKETYCMQMQSWQAFAERTRFIVQHSHMARAKDDRKPIESPAAQAVLVCTHCQKSLTRRPNNTTTARIPGDKRGGPAAAAGIVCPSCGRHMPRCGVCLIHLGTPDPARRGGAKELQKLGDVMAKFLTFCASCQHGFHADHARTWFKKHPTCPVPGCSCFCTVE